MCTHAEEKQQCCMPREERIESIASRVGHTNTRIFSLPAPSIRVCLFFRDISFSPPMRLSHRPPHLCTCGLALCAQKQHEVFRF